MVICMISGNEVVNGGCDDIEFDFDVALMVLVIVIVMVMKNALKESKSHSSCYSIIYLKIHQYTI